MFRQEFAIVCLYLKKVRVGWYKPRNEQTQEAEVYHTVPAYNLRILGRPSGVHKYMVFVYVLESHSIHNPCNSRILQKREMFREITSCGMMS